MPNTDNDRNKPVTVSVVWFHCGLPYRFDAYPPHRDGDVSKELREAADEWDKYRNWRAPKGSPMRVDVVQGRYFTLSDAIVSKLHEVLKLKYLKVDSLGFDIVSDRDNPQKT